MRELSRRTCLLELGVVALTVGCQRKSDSAETKKVCDQGEGTTQERSLRLALRYVEQAPDRERRCFNCSQFFRETQEEECGKCILISGSVNQDGSCARWSRRS